MKLDELKEDITYEGLCHDCRKPVAVKVLLNDEGQIEISGGALYRVKQQFGREELFFKCDACFAENKTLENYEECEVYTRVVGYLRPVNQYNRGKKAEVKMRKEFVNMKGK